jgi:hypothetical protein
VVTADHQTVASNMHYNHFLEEIVHDPTESDAQCLMQRSSEEPKIQRSDESNRGQQIVCQCIESNHGNNIAT